MSLDTAEAKTRVMNRLADHIRRTFSQHGSAADTSVSVLLVVRVIDARIPTNAVMTTLRSIRVPNGETAAAMWEKMHSDIKTYASKEIEGQQFADRGGRGPDDAA
jgi:hypothetical protein